MLDRDALAAIRQRAERATPVVVGRRAIPTDDDVILAVMARQDIFDLLVALDAALAERDNARASEREATVRYLRAMAQTYRDYHSNADAIGPVPPEIEKIAMEIAEEAHSEFRSENRGDFELIDGMVLARLSDERDAAIRARDELRAILRPLLADPWRDDGERYGCCAFCGKSPTDVRNRHAPDCPVLRRAALLGAK